MSLERGLAFDPIWVSSCQYAITRTKGDEKSTGEREREDDVLGIARRALVLERLTLAMHLPSMPALGGRVAEAALAFTDTAMPGLISGAVGGEKTGSVTDEIEFALHDY